MSSKISDANSHVSRRKLIKLMAVASAAGTMQLTFSGVSHSENRLQNITACISAEIREGKTDSIVEFFSQALSTTRSFNGALKVSAFYDKTNRQLTLIEEWRSKADHKAYIAHITDNGAMGQFKKFLTKPPTITYYTKIEI